MGSTLLRRVADTLSERGWSLAVAESCTGGLVSKLLTDLPGSSRYMRGSVVAYADDAKLDVLGVDEAAVRDLGAVSREVASQMALGAVRLFRADVGLSVTGIAGPDGARPGKPVGTVWFGVCVSGRARTVRARFSGDREAVRAAAAEYALRLLLVDQGDLRQGAPMENPRSQEG